MGRYGKSLRAVVSEITRSGDRSTLFWWLVDHHDEIACAAKGRRLRWVALCAQFTAAGLTDMNGKSASVATARRTWFRVREMVAEAREREASAAAPTKRVGATPPSRISKGWRPSGFRDSSQLGGNPTVQSPTLLVAGPKGLTSNAGGPPARPSPQGALVSPDDPPEVREKLRKIEASLQQADWFLGQSKRRTD
jgi:hypothetical protein